MVPRCRLESIGISAPRDTLFKQRSLDHAVKAGRAALKLSRCQARDVEVLINTGVYRDKHYAEPAFACFIQKELDINVEFRGRQVLSFDLVNGGCGMLNATHVISNMMRSGVARVGMVVASETNADRRPDPSYTYASSGAALVLDLSPVSSEGFGAFVFRTFEQHSELYSSVVSLAQKHGRLFIRKEQELEQTYLDKIPEVWQALLAEESITADEIDLVCASQVSPTFVSALSAALKMPREKIVDISEMHADTLTTSPFLAYAHARERGILRAGQKVAFLAVGSGVTVGAAIYHG